MPSTQSEVIQKITDHSMAVLRGFEEEDLAAMAASYFEAQGNIIAMMRRAAGGSEWTLAEMQGDRAGALFNQIDQELNRLNNRMNTSLEQSAIEQLEGAQEWSLYGLDQATPAGVQAQQPPLPFENIKALVNTPFQGAMFSQRYGLITDQMAADIRGALTQSMINGESMEDAALRIETVMGATAEGATAMEGYANRTMTIARSEIMRAQNLGRLSVYGQNSDLMEGTPEWVATADDRLCPWCLRRDGLTFDEIETEPVPSVRDKPDPWGNSTNLPLHPNCRCTVVPKLKSWADLGIEDMPEDLSDDTRAMRNEDGDWVEVPVQTFEDWKAERGAALGLGGEI